MTKTLHRGHIAAAKLLIKRHREGKCTIPITHRIERIATTHQEDTL